MFNSVSANIAAQKQADLFGDDSAGFELAAQDANGNSVEAVEELDPYEALVRAYEAEGMSTSDAQGCADADILIADRAARKQAAEDMLNDFNWVGSRHHY